MLPEEWYLPNIQETLSMKQKEKTDTSLESQLQTSRGSDPLTGFVRF